MLTPWMEPGEEARRRAAAHMSDVLSGPTDKGTYAYAVGSLGNAYNAIAGLLSLGMVLALTLAEERGADEQHMLEKADEILRGISSQLPE